MVSSLFGGSFPELGEHRLSRYLTPVLYQLPLSPFPVQGTTRQNTTPTSLVGCRTVFIQMRDPASKNVLTPSQVEALIENGHAIVIFGKRVLNLDSWLKYHPGGAKVILHVVGRDATDEINA